MPRIPPRLPEVRAAPLLLLLAAASPILQGCLTKALWHERQEAPPLAVRSFSGQVHEVRGQLQHGDPDNQVWISFSIPQDHDTPPQLRSYTESAPGVLKLVPPDRGGGDWQTLPGSQLFQPDGWGFRIYRGDYLTEPGVNASLWFHGRLEPQEICRLLPSHRVPTAMREQAGLRIPDSENDVLDRCLMAFARHDWLELATGKQQPGDYRRTALAFVDDKGRVVSPEQMRNQIASMDPGAARGFLAGCTLVARLDGSWQGQRNLHVQIPLPVLVQGRHLTLNRVLHSVHWSRTQVWHGEQAQRQALMDQLARVQLPLDSEVFAYLDAREAPGTTLLPTVARLLLTPLAVAADFLWMNSIYFKSLLESLKHSRLKGPAGKQN